MRSDVTTFRSELLDQLAFGTEMDVEGEDLLLCETQAACVVRYRTFDDLHVYCYRVASVVGLVCIRIFGYRDPAAEPLAERCGLAFQLTNIIRDVKEDAAMGRVYLPEEDLEQVRHIALGIGLAVDPARLRPLLAMEADRAREYLSRGDDLIPLVDEDSQPALWVLMTIYRRCWKRSRKRQYDVFSGKNHASPSRKLTVLGEGLHEASGVMTQSLDTIPASPSSEADWPDWPLAAPRRQRISSDAV